MKKRRSNKGLTQKAEGLTQGSNIKDRGLTPIIKPKTKGATKSVKPDVPPVIPASYSTKSIEADIEKALGGKKSPFTVPFSKSQQVGKR